jgi:hypothetical protein
MTRGREVHLSLSLSCLDAAQAGDAHFYCHSSDNKKRNGIRNEEALFNLIMRALILLRWLGSLLVMQDHFSSSAQRSQHPSIIELHECVENYCYWMRRINNDH